MDIFFAHRTQIDAALAEDSEAQWREFSLAVRRQKAAYLNDRARTPAWVLGTERDEPAAVNGDCLVGLPGSPGTAEGPVFRVLDTDDFAQFPKGAVLVARTTSPTWTPFSTAPPPSSPKAAVRFRMAPSPPARCAFPP